MPFACLSVNYTVFTTEKGRERSLGSPDLQHPPIIAIMALNIRQTLQGRHRTYRLIEALKAPTVFKAQVLPISSIRPPLVRDHG